MTMQLEGLSQPTDTSKVWISRPDALKKLAQADSLKVYKKIVQKYSDDIDTLTRLIISKQTQIDTLNSLDRTNGKIIHTYDKEIAIMKEQRGALEKELSVVNKELRREKRKRFISSVLGVLSTAGALFLGTSLK